MWLEQIIGCSYAGMRRAVFFPAYLYRVRDDVLDVDVLVNYSIHKRGIGAIFQQASHQVGEQVLVFADRRVDAASALVLPVHVIVQGFAQNEPKRREFIELMEDPKKVGMAIEELVRVHSIVLLPRRVTREVSMHGALFHAEDQVLVPTQAINMDPEEFPNPHEIDYERFPNRHVGFGLGPHRCLGIHLARRELRIALQVLHRKLPDYRLDPDSKAIGFGGMKGLASLPLVKAS